MNQRPGRSYYFLEVPCMSDIYLESDTAIQLGVDRGLLRDLRRDLLTRTDWMMVNNAVAYTPAAYAKIVAAVRARLAGSSALPSATQARPEQPAGQGEDPAATVPSPLPGRSIATCTVVSIPRLSTQRLVVRLPTGPAFCVRVKTNIHFIAGMQVECALRPGLTGTVHGRLPRSKGRW